MHSEQRVSAKIRVTAKTGEDPVNVSFMPDYQDQRNQEWANATPALHLSMTMRREVADLFVIGEAIDMGLTRNPDQPDPEQA